MKILHWKRSWGVCLGPIILLPEGAGESTKNHEIGHYKQWRKYHILYWFIVALPSVIRWLIDVLFHKKWSISKRCMWYYGHWPENDADRLGGVTRPWNT